MSVIDIDAARASRAINVSTLKSNTHKYGPDVEIPDSLIWIGDSAFHKSTLSQLIMADIISDMKHIGYHLQATISYLEVHTL